MNKKDTLYEYFLPFSSVPDMTIPESILIEGMIKLEGEIAPRMNFMGREVLTWSLNNYLGLANLPEVRKADADAVAYRLEKQTVFILKKPALILKWGWALIRLDLFSSLRRIVVVGERCVSRR